MIIHISLFIYHDCMHTVRLCCNRVLRGYTHVHAHGRTHTHAHAYARLYTCPHTHVCSHILTHTVRPDLHSHAAPRLYACLLARYMHVFEELHIKRDVHEQVYAHAQMHVCTHVHTRVHISRPALNVGSGAGLIALQRHNFSWLMVGHFSHRRYRAS